VLSHIPWYSVKGQERLAHDAGISPATVSRLIHGKSSPTFLVVWSIAQAIERRAGRSIDPRELVSVDGVYPTPKACDLFGCRRCQAEHEIGDDGVYRTVEAK
jgi:transcriptional regulator with XRE-family HTH domain